MLISIDPDWPCHLPDPFTLFIPSWNV